MPGEKEEEILGTASWSEALGIPDTFPELAWLKEYEDVDKQGFAAESPSAGVIKMVEDFLQEKLEQGLTQKHFADLLGMIGYKNRPEQKAWELSIRHQLEALMLEEGVSAKGAEEGEEEKVQFEPVVFVLRHYDDLKVAAENLAENPELKMDDNEGKPDTVQSYIDEKMKAEKFRDKSCHEIQQELIASFGFSEDPAETAAVELFGRKQFELFEQKSGALVEYMKERPEVVDSFIKALSLAGKNGLDNENAAKEVITELEAIQSLEALDGFARKFELDETFTREMAGYFELGSALDDFCEELCGRAPSLTDPLKDIFQEIKKDNAAKRALSEKLESAKDEIVDHFESFTDKESAFGFNDVCDFLRDDLCYAESTPAERGDEITEKAKSLYGICQFDYQCKRLEEGPLKTIFEDAGGSAEDPELKYKQAIIDSFTRKGEVARAAGESSKTCISEYIRVNFQYFTDPDTPPDVHELKTIADKLFRIGVPKEKAKAVYGVFQLNYLYDHATPVVKVFLERVAAANLKKAVIERLDLVPEGISRGKDFEKLVTNLADSEDFGAFKRHLDDELSITSGADFAKKLYGHIKLEKFISLARNVLLNDVMRDIAGDDVAKDAFVEKLGRQASAEQFVKDAFLEPIREIIRKEEFIPEDSAKLKAALEKIKHPDPEVKAGVLANGIRQRKLAGKRLSEHHEENPITKIITEEAYSAKIIKAFADDETDVEELIARFTNGTIHEKSFNDFCDDLEELGLESEVEDREKARDLYADYQLQAIERTLGGPIANEEHRQALSEKFRKIAEDAPNDSHEAEEVRDKIGTLGELEGFYVDSLFENLADKLLPETIADIKTKLETAEKQRADAIMQQMRDLQQLRNLPVANAPFVEATLTGAGVKLTDDEKRKLQAERQRLNMFSKIDNAVLAKHLLSAGYQIKPEVISAFNDLLNNSADFPLDDEEKAKQKLQDYAPRLLKTGAPGPEDFKNALDADPATDGALSITEIITCQKRIKPFVMRLREKGAQREFLSYFMKGDLTKRISETLTPKEVRTFDRICDEAAKRGYSFRKFLDKLAEVEKGGDLPRGFTAACKRSCTEQKFALRRRERFRRLRAKDHSLSKNVTGLQFTAKSWLVGGRLSVKHDDTLTDKLLGDELASDLADVSGAQSPEQREDLIKNAKKIRQGIAPKRERLEEQRRLLEDIAIVLEEDARLSKTSSRRLEQLREQVDVFGDQITRLELEEEKLTRLIKVDITDKKTKLEEIAEDDRSDEQNTQLESLLEEEGKEVKVIDESIRNQKNRIVDLGEERVRLKRIFDATDDEDVAARIASIDAEIQQYEKRTQDLQPEVTERPFDETLFIADTPYGYVFYDAEHIHNVKGIEESDLQHELDSIGELSAVARGPGDSIRIIQQLVRENTRMFVTDHPGKRGAFTETSKGIHRTYEVQRPPEDWGDEDTTENVRQLFYMAETCLLNIPLDANNQPKNNLTVNGPHAVKLYHILRSLGVKASKLSGPVKMKDIKEKLNSTKEDAVIVGVRDPKDKDDGKIIQSLREKRRFLDEKKMQEVNKRFAKFEKEVDKESKGPGFRSR